MIGEAIRVLVVDDHSLVRAGLKAVLGATRDIALVGEAASGKEAVQLVAQLKPDVVVMDLSMPNGDGIAATKAIVSSGTSSRVLVLSMHSEEEYVASAMEAGASGYIIKSNAERDIVNGIRAVAHGEMYVASVGAGNAQKRLASNGHGRSDRERYDMLTTRERDVLRRVALGYSAPEIGAQLQISPKTVDTYKQRIQEKADLAHRSEYVRFAVKLGLLSAEQRQEGD